MKNFELEGIKNLRRLFKNETGKRPVYKKKEINGYDQWLNDRCIRKIGVGFLNKKLKP